MFENKMEIADENQNCEKSLVQLPELVFHEIFTYFEYKALIFTLRVLYKKIRQYVDSFIEIKGIFMLTGENESPSKIIHIFKKFGKDIEGWYEYGPSCPIPISHVLKLNESKLQERLGKVLNHKVLCFTNKSSCILFDYNNLKWNCIQENVPFCDQTSNHSIDLISNLELVEFYTITTMDPAVSDVSDLCSMNLHAQCLNCEFGENGLFNVRKKFSFPNCTCSKQMNINTYHHRIRIIIYDVKVN